MSAPDYDAWAGRPPTTSSLATTASSFSASSFPGELPGAASLTTSAPTDVPLYPSSESLLPGDGHPSMAQGTVTYPLLFRTCSEVPRFYVPYRWWEDEATTVLWTFDIREISLVIQFGLFSDSNLPRTVLQSRNASTIDGFLSTFLQPYEVTFLPNFSHVQKVEEILRRSQSSTPSSIAWSWFPAQARQETDPLAIAMRIDAESHFQFKAVPFEEWVRCALGYAAPAVDWFLLQHNAFYILLSHYLERYADEVDKYREVEKHLRTRSPFAHRALVQCLTKYQNGEADDLPRSTGPGFEFIAGPIQGLFRGNPAGLTSILKVLSVLAVRFRQTYVHVTTMDWNHKFETSVPFLDDLLASISPTDLAQTLTRADESDFAGLSRAQITMKNEPTVAALQNKWHALSSAVWECCTALPELVGYIRECIETLHGMRNYHSTTAMINGLQTYGVGCLWTNVDPTRGTITMAPLLPPSVSDLLDASNNYATYRQQMREAPGIPFLYPHVQEYKRIGEEALNELFQES
ncbi:hypothetical protein VTN77DRAFT_2167 [Rasamsonia byssochlamydoides]|uniref:uncharacterized protein n=1 Tax=Rasamsonia byssochlamydoides TaxID=89139 RepID=UPI0037431D5F